MAKIKWDQAATALIFTDWQEDDINTKDANEYIKKRSDDRLQLILLRDIAYSLRVLRCQDFKQIPAILRTIKANTGRIPPKKRVIKNECKKLPTAS